MHHKKYYKTIAFIRVLSEHHAISIENVTDALGETILSG